MLIHYTIKRLIVNHEYFRTEYEVWDIVPCCDTLRKHHLTGNNRLWFSHFSVFKFGPMSPGVLICIGIRVNDDLFEIFHCPFCGAKIAFEQHTEKTYEKQIRFVQEEKRVEHWVEVEVK